MSETPITDSMTKHPAEGQTAYTVRILSTQGAELALNDLRGRLMRASEQLGELEGTYWEALERSRVNGKRQGVNLALSYVDEALRQLTNPTPGSSRTT